MDFSRLAAFALAQVTISLVPGPAVLCVSATAVASGGGATLRASLGILAGNAVYLAASIAGLGALVHSHPGAFKLVSLAGAFYLAWLGLRALSASGGARTDREHPAGANPNPFVAAFLLQLSNPKSMLFFGAMLPQFLTPGGWPAPTQMACLGGLGMVLELPILAGYGLLAQRAGSGHPTGSLWIRRAGGVLLLAAAIFAGTR